MFEKYFSVLDILIAIIWLVILVIVLSNHLQKIENDQIKGYFLKNYFFKAFFSLFFTVIYYFVLGGGDTQAYWDGAIVLNKLFFRSPTLYFEHLMMPPNQVAYIKHFNIQTGYPPGWIYREIEGWFICKLTSVVSLFTFRSLPATLLIFAYFISTASFRVFEVVVKIGLHSTRTAAWCLLFVPSVAFWCTGISKDSVMFWTILSLISIFLNLMIFRKRLSFLTIVAILFFFFLIINIRSFTLAAILAPLLVAFSARASNQFSSAFARISLRFIFILVGLVGFLYIGSSSYMAELANEAAVIQQDFSNNPIYTGKRYNIDISDPSPTGMLRAFPVSVFFGVYKPFIYEALSLSLLFNGIESTILLFMTLNFLFNGSPIKKIKWIFRNEFLVFSLFFVLLIGFMAGYTSVLFGVLVRIRAPLLPFAFLLFTTKSELQIQDGVKEINKPSTD
jgi:hypothetical protein